MKKRLIVLIVLLTAAIVCVVMFFFMPFPGWPAQKRAIEEINRNCDVPFALTMPETELQDIDEYVKVQGFGGYRLESNDMSFDLGGYPDVLDEFHIVRYEIKSPKYTFMGLRVGCSLDTAQGVMKQKGFTLNEHIYRKNGVGINIGLSGDIVTSFSVFVETSNVQHAIF